MNDDIISALSLIVSIIAIGICAIIISLDREQNKINSNYSIYNHYNNEARMIYDDN